MKYNWQSYDISSKYLKLTNTVVSEILLYLLYQSLLQQNNAIAKRPCGVRTNHFTDQKCEWNTEQP